MTLKRWSQEEKDAARDLWKAGDSADAIAAELSANFGVKRTRNAVLGRLFRMGLLGKKRGPSPCRGRKRAEFSQAWLGVQRA